MYLSDRTEQVTAEIQIRTIAMDFWASLEHDIRYKVDKTKLPEGINEECLNARARSPKLTDRCRRCIGGSNPLKEIWIVRGYQIFNKRHTQKGTVPLQ